MSIATPLSPSMAHEPMLSSALEGRLHHAMTAMPRSRTLSEGDATSCCYSSVSSVRDVIASARQTRANLRKSRAALKLLRAEAQQTLQDAYDLRHELQLFLAGTKSSRYQSTTMTKKNSSSIHESEDETDDVCSTSDMSELTLESL